MGVLSNLTYTHLEVGSTVDEIHRALARARQVCNQPESILEALVGLGPRALMLRQTLADYLDFQRTHLFPRAGRVLGDDMEEVTLLWRCHGQMLEAIDRFAAELPQPGNGVRAGNAAHVAHLQSLFEDFLDLYEYHCSLERQFYESYSTILFPGGAIAE